MGCVIGRRIDNEEIKVLDEGFFDVLFFVITSDYRGS